MLLVSVALAGHLRQEYDRVRRDTQQHGGEKVRATLRAFSCVIPISPRGRWVARLSKWVFHVSCDRVNL